MSAESVPTALMPKFSSIPSELREHHRWVVWKGVKGAKVPYCATTLDSRASVIDPDTWAPFPAAQTAFEEGGYSGVGFVLNGDGIVAVDVDKCAPGGVPSPDALDLLARIGCQYIEVSPSGNGLHGFGFGNNILGRRGTLGGVRVELYSNLRYLTVTGQALRTGPLVPLPGFSEVADLLCPPPPTEENFSNLLSSSVGVPVSSLPSGLGERNQSLFDLARYLKAEMPNATHEQLRPIVQEWHRQALPVIGTKDFAVTWSEFRYGWKRVKYPHGFAILGPIMNGINFAAPLPPGIDALGYGEAGNRLVRICAALQAHEGDGPFFLSARKAGELSGQHFTDAWKALHTLVADRVLQLVQPGTKTRASRYRYVWKAARRGGS